MSAADIGAASGFAANPFNPIFAGLGYVVGGMKDALDMGAEAKDKQRALEEQRKRDLDAQAAARAAAAAKAASSGQRVGLRSQFVTGVGGLGFGSGSTAPGLSRGTLFGN